MTMSAEQRIKEIMVRMCGLQVELGELAGEADVLSKDIPEDTTNELVKWAEQYATWYKERLEDGADPRQLEFPF